MKNKAHRAVAAGNLTAQVVGDARARRRSLHFRRTSLYYQSSRVLLKQQGAVTENSITIPQKTRFQIALILAILADALQIILLPLFVEGAESPADDVLDAGVGAVLVYLLGWHWEFLPSLLAKLVPGVDLVPLWTLAVANVYRKSKQIAVSSAEAPQAPRD